MMEDYVLPSQMYRRICELSELPYRRLTRLGPRTVAGIHELKAEGTRCFGGRAPRPETSNEMRGVK